MTSKHANTADPLGASRGCVTLLSAVETGRFKLRFDKENY